MSQSSEHNHQDPFNQDYECQHDQTFIDGMEQQLHMTPYNEDDLHLAYGNGRHDEFNYIYNNEQEI